MLDFEEEKILKKILTVSNRQFIFIEVANKFCNFVARFLFYYKKYHFYVTIYPG